MKRVAFGEVRGGNRARRRLFLHADHASQRPCRFRRNLDARLPMPGTRLKRDYKGHAYEVEVLDNGFAYDGEVYQSLSAVATAITGGHWNGYLFFNLKDPGKENE